MVYVKAFLLFLAETAAFPLEETNSQATPKGLILKECNQDHIRKIKVHYRDIKRMLDAALPFPNRVDWFGRPSGVTVLPCRYFGWRAKEALGVKVIRGL